MFLFFFFNFGFIMFNAPQKKIEVTRACIQCLADYIKVYEINCCRMEAESSKQI